MSEVEREMILTIAAVASWCLAAYMVPVVAYVVWRRRKADPTEVIQMYDVGDGNE